MDNRRGFTLIEMLVTASMLAIITAAGMAVFSAGTRSARKAARCGRMAQYGQMALNAISADIRAMATHEGTRLTALDVMTDGHDTDTIDFLVVRPIPRRMADEECSLAEVGYSIGRETTPEDRWLLRREDRTLDDDPLEGGQVSLAGPQVAGLNFEFYDGLIWASEWKGTDEWPTAIRITVMVVDEEEGDEERREPAMAFSTTARIMAQ